MTTYNGSATVLEQLESFSRQSRRPDELVVCDDRSSDDTVAVVRRFAAHAPFPVRLEVNGANLGFAHNFAKAIGLTGGDLILLSDQDDRWHPEKLAKFAAAFGAGPGPGLIFCDANLVDSDLTPLGRTWWQSRGFGPDARRKFVGGSGASLILKNPAWFAAGATMGFAARYKPLVLPVAPGWTHDAWIASLVAAVAPVALVEEPLNDYRQHASQVFGDSKRLGQTARQARRRGSSADHFRATADRYAAMRDRLVASGLPVRDPRLGDRVAGKIAHWRARARMRGVAKVARFPLIARELVTGRYHEFSQDWKSLALDLIA